jgi:hypothetical protein
LEDDVTFGGANLLRAPQPWDHCIDLGLWCGEGDRVYVSREDVVRECHAPPHGEYNGGYPQNAENAKIQMKIK